MEDVCCIYGVRKQKERYTHTVHSTPAPSRVVAILSTHSAPSSPHRLDGLARRLPIYTIYDTRGICVSSSCSCCTTKSSKVPTSVLLSQQHGYTVHTIAVSSGSTVHNICTTASSANSAQSWSSSEGGAAKLDARNARVSLTRSPSPGS